MNSLPRVAQTANHREVMLSLPLEWWHLETISADKLLAATYNSNKKNSKTCLTHMKTSGKTIPCYPKERKKRRCSQRSSTRKKAYSTRHFSKTNTLTSIKSLLETTPNSHHHSRQLNTGLSKKIRASTLLSNQTCVSWATSNQIALQSTASSSDPWHTVKAAQKLQTLPASVTATAISNDCQQINWWALTFNTCTIRWTKTTNGSIFKRLSERV